MASAPHYHAARVAGVRIRELRVARRLSRRVLAELAGIHENTLKGIELGHGNPTLSVVSRIADALGVDIHDLICSL